MSMAEFERLESTYHRKGRSARIRQFLGAFSAAAGLAELDVSLTDALAHGQVSGEAIGFAVLGALVTAAGVLNVTVNSDHIHLAQHEFLAGQHASADGGGAESGIS